MNLHTNTLDSIKKLEALGYQGIDADLATSLFEYGMAWIVTGDETVFIYGVQNGEKDGECQYTRFDRCVYGNDTNPYSEWDWAEFGDVWAYVGTTQKEWNKLPLTQKVFDLRSHYGFENVFGSCYWEGFEITE